MADDVKQKAATALLDKKEAAATYKRFMLHVMLIEQQHDVARPVALAQAYVEGPSGRLARLPK